VAADGYELFTPTKPGPFEGVGKLAAVIFEMRPCSYQLLGGSDDGVLYYEEACRANEPVFKAYIPGQEVELVNAAPISLNYNVVSHKEAMSRHQAAVCIFWLPASLSATLPR
jgi:hypothetical protein